MPAPSPAAAASLPVPPAPAASPAPTAASEWIVKRNSIALGLFYGRDCNRSVQYRTDGVVKLSIECREQVHTEIVIRHATMMRTIQDYTV